MSAFFTSGTLNLRERINKPTSIKDTSLVDLWFLGDGAVTTYPLTHGYKPHRVYVAGIRKREGLVDDFIVKFDGFIYTLVFAAPPANLTDIVIDAIRT